MLDVNWTLMLLEEHVSLFKTCTCIFGVSFLLMFLRGLFRSTLSQRSSPDNQVGAFSSQTPDEIAAAERIPAFDSNQMSRPHLVVRQIIRFHMEK